MASEDYTEQENFSEVSQKRKRIIILIFSICFVVVGLGITYYFIFKYPKTNSYFLTALQTYSNSREELQENWSQLTSKAKTPAHYLMLLKRLDAFVLQQEYQSTLIRALWKHQNINSIAVLGVEYYLSLSLGEIPEEIYNKRDVKSLQKVIDNSVDILWDEYPDMVRLYYVIRFKKGDTSSLITRAFKFDEVLSLYKKIVDDEVLWQDYHNVWLITEQQVFLYLAAVFAKDANEELIAQDFYKSISEDFLFQIPQRALKTSLLFRDIKTLKKYVGYFPTQEATLSLAALYTLELDFPTALNVLQAYSDIHQNDIFTYEWDMLHLWLMTHLSDSNRSSQTVGSISDIERLYTTIKKRHPTRLETEYEYFTYLYLQDPQKLLDLYREKKQILFSKAFLNDVKVKFLILQIQKTNNFENQRNVYLWKTLDQTNNDVLWQRIAASYFISLNFREEIEILFSRYNNADIIPYRLLWFLKNNQKSATEKSIKNIKNSTDYPWWVYYNIAVFQIAQEQYSDAQKNLTVAENKYDILYVKKFEGNTAEYYIYIWAQHARLAMYYLDDYDLAQNYINKIRNSEVSFVYLAELEQDLQRLKKQ